MSLQHQLRSLKEHWLLVVLILLAVFMTSYLPKPSPPGVLEQSFFAKESTGIAADQALRIFPRSSGFSPETEERLVSVQAFLTTEVKRGTFAESTQQIQNIVDAADALLLHSSSMKHEVGRKSYEEGTFEIKVVTEKYAAVASQLKEIGEVQSFQENTLDVTGEYVDFKDTLAAERTRLGRYDEMYQAAGKVEEKLQISDRIFDQERRVRFLEESLKQIDQRVDYSTLFLTVREKRSVYADAVFVTFSSLVTSFLQSVNTLVTLVIIVIPWLVVLWLGRFLWRKKLRK